MEEEFDYEAELKIFCKSRGIWNDKKKCPTKFVINKLKTITVTHKDGYDYLQNIHDGFTTKRIQYQTCLYCHKELTGKQKKILFS